MESKEMDGTKVGLERSDVEVSPGDDIETKSNNPIETKSNNPIETNSDGEEFSQINSNNHVSTDVIAESRPIEPMQTSNEELDAEVEEPNLEDNLMKEILNHNKHSEEEIKENDQYCDSEKLQDDMPTNDSETCDNEMTTGTDTEIEKSSNTDDVNRVTESEMDESAHFKEDSINSNLQISNVRSYVDDEDSRSGLESLNKSESAFQRLASLGVIADDKPIAESKESLLQKLASRGSISITSSGGVPSSSSNSLSITTDSPTHKHGQKSSITKQKCKKIKIDPGKSTDIDKDFDSLINFLSAKDRQEKEVSESSIRNETNENVLQVQPENISESCSDPEGIRVNGKPVEEQTVSNEALTYDIDTEGNDELKASHNSDHAEDDERMSVTTEPRNTIEEGSAEILPFSKNVFYNKVQEFNRDMSIAALTVFSEMHQQDPRTRNKGKKRKANDESDSSIGSGEDGHVFEPGKKCNNGIIILEALSATGLRSIRYAREIPGVKEIIANDISANAVESIKKNIDHNRVEDLVSTTQSDASFLMYQRLSTEQCCDAIDLDPYGCPSRFLDSAVQVVRDGGLLLVTCTDMAVLAGNSSETCHAKYGAVSLRSQSCHEMAIRIALQCIESHANRYGRYIVPLLSFSADFYIRVIVQVYTSPVTCKKTTSKLSMVFQCTGCQTFTLQPLGSTTQENANTQPKFSLPHAPLVSTNCFHCQHKHHMGGPIWTAPIYSSKFVEKMLQVVDNGRFGTSKRMQGMLEVIREELLDTPLYYTINGLCSRLHCQTIPLIDIRSAILNAGYRVSSSHAAPTAIKTNAPSKLIWDIMRCWVHMNPVSQKRLVIGSVPATIILEPPTFIANFDIHPKARTSSSMRKLLRYQPNPEKNWGPGMRARCNNSEGDKDEKRKLNQNKNKNKTPRKKTVEIIEVVTIDDEDEEVTEESTEPVTEPASSASVT